MIRIVCLIALNALIALAGQSFGVGPWVCFGIAIFCGVGYAQTSKAAAK